MAMLALAARWRGRETMPRLVAVTIDHGLRAASRNEARAVAQLAAKLRVEHRTLRWTGRKPKTGLMEAARLARYRLLSQVAQEIGARHVLTAHTLDDQAETVLFRLARGSGITGLAGMQVLAPMPVDPGFGLMLLRPLLGIPKARLIATLKAAGIRYAEDPTNRDPRFTRSRLRDLLPLLAQEGLTASRLGLLASRVQRIEDTLLHVLAAANTEAVSSPWDSDNPVTLRTDIFSDLPSEVAIRVLGGAIARAGDGARVELGKLEALYDAMREPLSAHMLRLADYARFRRTLGNALVTLAGDSITVERAPPRRAARQTGLTKARYRGSQRAKRR